MMKSFNLLMESRILPTDLKVASVKPLLKKQFLSSAEFNNFFRPISNMGFLLKCSRIGGTALDSEWFRSYLSYRTQFVNVVMAVVLFFLLLRRFFEKVFLSIP